MTGAITNVVLNYIFIPFIGAFGAAVATLVSQIVADLLTLMLFKNTRMSSIMMLKSIFKNETLFNSIRVIIRKRTKE